LGHRVTVTVPASGVTYAIDSGTFTLPGGLSFASATGLVMGQEVSVVVQGPVSTGSGSGGSTPWLGPASTTFTTNSITLEPSQITGLVGTVAVGELSFTLGTFPNFFVPPSAGGSTPPIPAAFQITVDTTSGTTFTNFTPDSIMGVAANDVVSVQGWLFLSPIQPLVCTASQGCPLSTTIAAEAVVLRLGPTPLF